MFSALKKSESGEKYAQIKPHLQAKQYKIVLEFLN